MRLVAAYIPAQALPLWLRRVRGQRMRLCKGRRYNRTADRRGNRAQRSWYLTSVLAFYAHEAIGFSDLLYLYMMSSPILIMFSAVSDGAVNLRRTLAKTRPHLAASIHDR